MRHADTRTVDPKHVLDLCESIIAVGLIEPIAVDEQTRLVAGLHRYTACRMLLLPSKKERLALWRELINSVEEDGDDVIRVRRLPLGVGNRLPNAMIPVHYLPFDADKDPRAALSAEVAENEKRRDYTRREVLALRDRLEAVGYSFAAHRPKGGRRPGIPALQTIIGKSRRTVERLLSTPNGGVKEKAQLDPNKALDDLARALNRYLSRSPKDVLVPSISDLLQRIEGLVGHNEHKGSDKPDA
jgi:hypothetical protein